MAIAADGLDYKEKMGLQVRAMLLLTMWESEKNSNCL